MAPQIRRCQAGLQVLAVPVQLDGRHVATWMSGQVLGRRPTGEEIATLTRHLNQEGIHIDSRTLESRLLRCPVIASERLQAIGRLLVLSSLHIQEALREHADRVWLRYQQGEPSCVTRAKNFMQMHLGERLTPPQAAAAVHADPGGFTRLFRKATGLSFAAYLTRLRIQRAKVLLAGSLVPYNNIHSASGFPSKARFARAFREATGQTPAAYRAKFSAPV